MSDILVIKEAIEEDTSPYFFARVVDGFGVALQTDDVIAQGVTMRVYDLSDDSPNTAILTASSLDPATSYNSHALMYDVLQVAGWTKDSVGYNFFYMPDISLLATSGTYGGKILRWEFQLDLSAALGSGKAWINYETLIRPQKSS